MKSSSFPESRTLLFQSLPCKAPQLVRGPRHSAVLEGHRWFSRCHIILSLCIWDCYPSHFRVPKASLPPPLWLNLVTAAPRLARALPCTLSQPAQHSLQPSASSGVPLRGSCRPNESPEPSSLQARHISDEELVLPTRTLNPLGSGLLPLRHTSSSKPSSLCS